MVRKKRHLVNLTWRYDHTCDALMSLKSATAIYVLALVVTFLRFFRNIAAAFSVSGGLTKRAMHHVRRLRLGIAL